MTLKTDMMQKPFWQKNWLTDIIKLASSFVSFTLEPLYSGQASVSMQNWDTDHV